MGKNLMSYYFKNDEIMANVGTCTFCSCGFKLHMVPAKMLLNNNFHINKKKASYHNELNISCFD